MENQTQLTVKQWRIKVATSYRASGYGRGLQTRNVYLIDEKYYAYHPEYASQCFRELKEELKGYVAVNYMMFGDEKQFYQTSGMDNEHRTESEMLMKTKSQQPTHLFGKPLAMTIFDNTHVQSPSTVQIETRIANVATEEIICTVTDDDVKKATAKAELIVKAVNMHNELVNGLRKALEVFAISDKKEGQEKAFLELSKLLKKAEQK